MPQTYARYSPEVEDIADDEAEIAEKIIAVMSKGAETVREREGRALRASHAKAHAVLTGELEVRPGLPPELAQGLFAEARIYPVVVRMAHTPGELLDDRKVSTPRGFALKALGVAGPKIAEHEGGDTQDWLLATGEVFIASNVKVFAGEIAMTEASTPMPEAVKGAVSAVSQATNKALQAIGVDAANIDFFGHPKLHPAGETYFSQAPIRYGDHIAKLRVRPLEVGVEPDAPVEIDSENGLREAMRAATTQSLTYAVEVQLCTDLDRMPVEDAHARWSQEDSPYREVARITLPAQAAYAESRADVVEGRFSFNPAHSLEAHRPLGSIMRARLRVYGVMAARRRTLNGQPAAEPTGPEAVPA